MYKIVDYESGFSYPSSFSNFDLAFKIHQLKYPNYFIEYWDFENENMDNNFINWTNLSAYGYLDYNILFCTQKL